MPFVVSQVPEVSPGIVIETVVHVLAEEIVYENGYDLLNEPFVIAPPNVHVRLE